MSRPIEDQILDTATSWTFLKVILIIVAVLLVVVIVAQVTKAVQG